MKKRPDLKSFAARSVIVLAVAAMWVLLLFTFAGLSGCIAPASPPDDTTEKNPPPPVIVSPDDSPEDRDISLAVSAEASLVATLYELLGDSGSLTVDPSSPIVLRRPEATLTIAPGTRLEYELGPSGGSITFANPRPTVSVRKWGLKLSPRLARLDLSTDNTGTAHVESGPLKFSRRFDIAWTDTDPIGQSPAVAELPVVTMFTATWCGACKTADTALAAASAAGTLPFRIERVGEPHPFPVSLPYFEWRDVRGERFGIQSWQGLDELVRRWRLTETSASPQASTSRPAGPQWTFPGSTRDDLLTHLRTHPNHRTAFAAASLGRLSFDELLGLHSRHHNETPPARPVRSTASS